MKAGKVSTLALASVLTAGLVLGGCSNNGTAEADKQSGTTQVKPEDPFGKYDPPIEVSTVRSVNQGFKYKDGDTIDNNIWTKIFMDQYGIKVKNLWVVDDSQYRQKLNISIASGDIPDFMLVNKEEMMRMHEAEQLEDLTKILEQNASPYLKELLNQDNGTALKAATFGGKLVGIPQMQVNGGVSTGAMLYVRADWMKKLNLPEPKTMEDVFRIAIAFAKNDPDGNGKADTVGFGLNKDLFQGHGNVTGLMNGYKAYPNMWLKDSAGKLVYGSILPEVKTALEKLRELYANGAIDQEFSVKPASKLAEEVASGRLGFAYGNVSDGGFIQKLNVEKDPSAEWSMYPITSVDGKPAHPQLNDTAGNFYVVKKGAKHPEAMVRLANIYLKHYYETNYAPDPNPFISQADGVYPGKYQPVTIDPLNVNLEAFRLVQKALADGDGSKLGFPANVHYDRLTKYAQGDKTMWFSTAVFGAKGSYSVIDYYDKNKLGIYNEFQGAATPAMSEKMSSLRKMQDEIFTKIIMGQSPVSDFDTFVKDWKRLGGDQITEEVNKWYSQQ
ncbi:putative aldouronate transport system substrate-binding protein [Paenibacillus sp. UNCCL117]|uniref:extracellular solute-binding protein n=1 Tax=unclassified Paenibacillus TaxID=185978 RepID=UPI00088313FF|nr:MULTISPECIES: extracellular solute-binding protein [unclassified Paenibacillus]SDE26460.1 carbohydrate ABC transporter substrate-binding protein, CUT1 family [Paenibacillus sp. cl123]SFW62628.1 putative aldouronate transport system substrate-binding protein [Paenibacillus sp. UNCCL117]